jgi:hypothetical protein
VYLLQINQIRCRSLITALVSIKIKCYLAFTYVRINFIGYVEIIAFQRLKMNIFKVQYIRTLNVQVTLFRLKCTPSSFLCTFDMKTNQFVVANYLPIHINESNRYGLNPYFGRHFGSMFEVWVYET